MRVPYKGLMIAGLQIVLVTSLGAKYLVDRARLPRVWVRTASYDPNLPIRGRYVSLRLEVQLPPGVTISDKAWSTPAELKVENSQLVAVPKEGEWQTGVNIQSIVPRAPANLAPIRILPSPLATAPPIVVIQEPVLFFISEHAKDPTWHKAGEELWAEVSIPRRGPPRPIRLGLKKNGILAPLQFD